MATYWERRVQMADASLEKSERAIAKRTHKFYESELADLSREIASYYKRYGKDNVLEYRAMMQSMDALDRDLLIRNVEEFEKRYPELKSVVEVRKSIYKLNRLEGLQASAKVHLVSATAKAAAPLDAHFAKTAANAANAVSETLGKGKNFHTFDSDAIRQFVGTHWADGKSYSETIWGNTDRLATYVQQDMAKALARGVSYEQMTSELHKRFVDVSEANIMRLVQTEGTYVARAAQAAELKREGFDSYYINPVGDERTCEVCGDVGKHSHDEVYRFDDAVVGQNFPPLHPRCRCQIAPAVSDWDAWQKQQINKKRAVVIEERMVGPAEQDHGTAQSQNLVFGGAKTKEEAIAFLKDNLGFSNVSPSFTLDELNQLASGFSQAFQQAPSMVGKISAIKAKSMQACASCVASTECVDPDVYRFNLHFDFDRKSMAESASDSQYCCNPENFESGNRWWTQKDGVNGFIKHEFTHAIEARLTMLRLGFDVDDDVGYAEVLAYRTRYGEVSSEIVDEAFKSLGIERNGDNIARLVSEYGAKNSRETMAEANSCEDPEDSVCNAIRDVLNKKIKEAGF